KGVTIKLFYDQSAFISQAASTVSTVWLEAFFLIVSAVIIFENCARHFFCVDIGAISRLRSVLMTVSIAALGLVPMLLATSVGSEVQRPLATIAIDDSFTSTLLTLLNVGFVNFSILTKDWYLLIMLHSLFSLIPLFQPSARRFRDSGHRRMRNSTFN
ncbi:efflux RND transporter permease subunit, partial [Kaarinaea lacus]